MTGWKRCRGEDTSHLFTWHWSGRWWPRPKSFIYIAPLAVVLLTDIRQWSSTRIRLSCLEGRLIETLQLLKQKQESEYFHVVALISTMLTEIPKNERKKTPQLRYLRMILMKGKLRLPPRAPTVLWLAPLAVPVRAAIPTSLVQSRFWCPHNTVLPINRAFLANGQSTEPSSQIYNCFAILRPHDL